MFRKKSILMLVGLLMTPLLWSAPATATSLLLKVAPGLFDPPAVWISPSDVRGLPLSGTAWEGVCDAAQEAVTSPDLSDEDSCDDLKTMAKALVHVTGQADYYDDIVQIIEEVQGTETNASVLEIGKNLLGYIIAADLVRLPDADDQDFRDWLLWLLEDFEDGDEKTLRGIFEDKPNNWGTLGTAARAAIASYLGDREELQEIASLFEAWMGNETVRVEHGFVFEFNAPMDWHDDENAPKGINPQGATKDACAGGCDPHNIDGVLPDDQRRVGSFCNWSCGELPPFTNGVYTSLQGVVALAVILTRAGYDPWHWEDRAILRAFRWLYDEAQVTAWDAEAGGDDAWMPYVLNHYYADDQDFTPFTVYDSADMGKNIAWTDWTFGSN